MVHFKSSDGLREGKVKKTRSPGALLQNSVSKVNKKKGGEGGDEDPKITRRTMSTVLRIKHSITPRRWSYFPGVNIVSHAVK